MTTVEDYIDFEMENMLDLSMFDSLLPEMNNEFAVPVQAKPVPKRRKRLTIKHTILALRRKHDELCAELENLQLNAPLGFTKSKWQERSIEQARLAKLAKLENGRLRELLNQYLQLSKGLERMYSKIQQINQLAFTDVQQFAVLGMTKRQESLTGILQHQYNLLSSHWIRHGLYQYENTEDDISKAQLQTSCTEPFIDYVKCSSYSKSVTEVSNIIWNMLDFCADDSHKAVHVIGKEMECFDNEILYSRFICQNEALAFPPFEARVAIRRFIEKDRVVVIWHTIIDDTLYPWNPKYWRNNASGWMVIQSQGQNKSRILSYMHLAAPTITSEYPGIDICTLMTNMLAQFESDMAQCDIIIANKIAEC